MTYGNLFKNLFESVPDYRKIVLIIFSIKDDKNLLKEISFNKIDISQLSLEFEIILLEQHQNYIDFVKDQA